ncbi:hypothetical protein [Desertibaculum subflavum]|uniref:hypothetical protein n=1 Tax=Desertibaculum subflavum TaxID=2268458 RepID=UPI0013C4FB38
MRMAKHPALLALTIALSMAPVFSAQAIVAGEVDTFTSGTTENWFAGGALGSVPPVPPGVSAGGPGGAGDNFLLMTGIGIGGGGAGSRLVAMNATQWSGNYTAAGITGIAMDLRNFGAVDLSIRLLLEDPIPGPPANQAVTSFAALLPAGGGWTSVVFPVAAADLTALLGDVTALLTDVTVLRLFHGTGAAFPGEAIAGQLGVDNIRAIGTGGSVAVAEPAGLVVLVAGLGMVGMLRNRQRSAN